MSTLSNWPLPPQGIRFITPEFILNKLANTDITRDCYPTAMGYYPKAHRHSMVRERHDDNLLIYCDSGEGEVTLQGVTHPVVAGDVIILPEGEPHAYQASNDNPWTIFWFHFQGELSASYIELLGYSSKKPLLHITANPVIKAQFNELLTVTHTGYDIAAFIHASLQLRYLMSLMNQEYNRHQAQRSMNLDTVQEFMRKHIEQSLDLDTLADSAQLSKHHFCMKYKKLTGHSPIKHFINMKIEYACSLLDSTEQSVATIASNLGYDDPLYFSRIFKKTVGISPRDYRKLAKK